MFSKMFSNVLTNLNRLPIVYTGNRLPFPFPLKERIYYFVQGHVVPLSERRNTGSSNLAHAPATYVQK